MVGGVVSGLSLDARVSLMSAFNSHSLQGLLSLLPYEVADSIEEDVYKSNFRKVLNEGMGINDDGSLGLNLFSYRKNKHFIDVDREIGYIENKDAWDVFNYDGFIRGMRLVRLHNEAIDKNEKMYYLFKLGMCNIGYCNSKNPFGEREQSGGWISLQVKNYDLQYRMYQMAGQKYYFSPDNLKHQLDNCKQDKRSGNPNWIVNNRNHFYENTCDFTNTNKLKGQYTNSNHYLHKIKVKHERLIKGKYYQCDDISNWFRTLIRYTLKEEVRLYWSDACPYTEENKKVLYNYFRTFPYDPSYFSADLDYPIDQY